MKGFGVREGGVLEVSAVAAAAIGGGFEVELDFLGLGCDGFVSDSSGSSVMVTIDGD